jgi:hypothetical protein
MAVTFRALVVARLKAMVTSIIYAPGGSLLRRSG